MNRILLQGAIALLAAVLCAPAFAAQAVLEEIVVTAEKRESNVQDTAIAITAMSEEFIEDFNVRGPEDLQNYLPSVTIQPVDVTIRGVGRNFRTLGGDPGVATYTNGIYAEDFGIAATENALFDIQRVEVLRGPQGTLYGRNAIGGALNYITNPPTHELHGTLRHIRGDSNLEQYFGILNVPIIKDKLAVRFTAMTSHRGGNQDAKAVAGSIPLSDPGTTDDGNITMALLFTPNDNWELSIRANDRHSNLTPALGSYLGDGPLNDRGTRFTEPCQAPGGACFLVPAQSQFLTPGAGTNLPVNGDGYGEDMDFESYPDHKGFQLFNQNQGALDLKWHTMDGALTVRYIFGYSDFLFHFDNDSGGGGRGTDAFLSSTAATAFGEVPQGRILREDHFDVIQDLWAKSHEIQFITNLEGRWNLVGGLYKYFANTTQILDLRDPKHLGTFTDAPSYGFLAGTIAAVFPNSCGLGDGVDGAGVASCVGRWNGDANGTYFYYDNETDVDAFAAYVQGEIDLSEQLKLTLGVRYSKDEKEGREWRHGYFELDPAAFALDLPTTNALLTGFGTNGDTPRLQGIPLSFADRLQLDGEWSDTTWRVNLDWAPNDDMLIYGNMTTGYRAGGFHLGLAQNGDYKQEKVLAYEVGYKGEFFDNTLRINLAAYFYDYEDQQLRNVGVFPGPGGTAINGDNVINAPKSENYGFEAEWVWVVDQLTVGGLYSFMETEITDDLFATDRTNPAGSGLPQNLKGNELNRAPQNKFTLWFNYQWDLADQGAINFYTTYAWTDEQKHSLFDTAIDVSPDYWRWDGRVAWTSPSQKWRVSGFVNNITDETSLRIINFSTNATLFPRTGTMTQPRSYGIEIYRSFGN